MKEAIAVLAGQRVELLEQRGFGAVGRGRVTAVLSDGHGRSSMHSGWRPRGSATLPAAASPETHDHRRRRAHGVNLFASGDPQPVARSKPGRAGQHDPPNSAFVPVVTSTNAPGLCCAVEYTSGGTNPGFGLPWLCAAWVQSAI